MARNPIERALGVWSAANYRNVMLPGLGVVTCGELCDAIADIKAENEEQRERLIQFANAFDAGYAAAESALAERAAVKVKALDEDDYEEITNAAGIAMRRASRGIRGQVITVQDSFDWWVMKETERRIRSALEPAAPEGRQDDEPRAYIVHAPEDDYYGTGPDRLQFHPLAQRDMDNGYRQTPLYGRPAEQAVTEAGGPFVTFANHAIEKTDDGWVWRTSGNERICDWFGPSDFGALKAAMEAGR